MLAFLSRSAVSSAVEERVVRDFLQSFLQLFTSNIQVLGTTLPFSLSSIFLRFVLPLVVYLVVWRLLRRPSRRLIVRMRVSRRARHAIVRWLRLIIRTLFVILLVLLAAGILGAETQRFIGVAFRFLNQPIYSSGNTKISLLTIILAVPIVYVASWLSKVVRFHIDRTVLSHMSMDHARRFSTSNLLRYAFLIIFILIGLSFIGIDLSSLVVIFGVLGVGIGFGLQSIVANFFAGLVIFVSRPIKVGDRILVNGHEGDVEQIRLIASVINTLTNETLIIPNSQIVVNVVHNYSYQDKRIIIVNGVQVSYRSDLDRVEAALLRVGNENPFRIPEMTPTVLFLSFDDSGITVNLRTWIQNAQDKMKAHSWNNLEIWREFKRSGIEIPFPQMDLHVKDTPRSTREE
jgi:small-conductance mechanosensitive channel